MSMRLLRSLPIAVALLAVLAGSAHAAKPEVCKKSSVRRSLDNVGKSADAGFNQILCADVTGDGNKDAIFTVLSGGSAGPTHFGVVLGAPDGSSEGIQLYRRGYKVSVDAVNDTRFDAQQPIYRKNDKNCCPSGYSFTPYRWTGSRFKAGKTRTYKKAKQRFFDQM